jgi:hypothetical protein
MQSTPSSNKIGPYGGPGGNPFDITTPTKLVSVQVWSNDKVGEGVINGISFSYVKEKGKPAVYSGPWGTKTPGKAPHQVQKNWYPNLIDFLLIISFVVICIYL